MAFIEATLRTIFCGGLRLPAVSFVLSSIVNSVRQWVLSSKIDRRSPAVHVCAILAMLVPLAGCLTSSTLMAQLTSRPPPSSTAPPAAISGRVINAVSGQPVPRALLQIGTQAVLSDGEGKFLFRDPGMALSGLTVQKPGYSLEPEMILGGSVAGLSTQDPNNVEIVLWPEAILTGTVTSPDGEPLPHVQVMTRHTIVDEQGWRQQFAGQAVTDSTGSWRIPVSAGSYSIEVPYVPRMPGRPEALLPYIYPPGAVDGTRELVSVRSGQELRIQLEPSLAIPHGIDLPYDAAGAEGRQPRIVAISPGGQTFQAGIGRATVPGRLHLELPPGSYRLEGTMFEADGMLFGDSFVTVPDHDVTAPVMHFSNIVSTPLEMIVEANSTAQTPSSSSPSQVNALSFNLVLQPLQTNIQSPFQFGVRPRMERDGTIRFQAPPGTYKLTGISSAGWYVRSAVYGGTDLLQAPMTISRSAGNSSIRIVVSNGTGSLKGSTRSSGTPTEAWIYLMANAPTVQPLLIRRSSTDGSVNISGLAPGSYRVLALPYRMSLDSADPSSTSRFASFMGSVSILAGSTANLDLDVVPAKEIQP